VFIYTGPPAQPNPLTGFQNNVMINTTTH